MFSEKTKYIVAWVFLMAFVLIKVSGLHAFAHQQDHVPVKDCVLCQLTSRENTTPVLSVDNSVNFNVYKELVFPVIQTSYENLLSEKPSVCELFNTSPPFYSFS